MRSPPMALSSTATQLVMFDLDGTLVDTLIDLTKAINAMLSALNQGPVETSQVRTWIGNGVDELVRQALTRGAVELNDKLITQGISLFREHYANHCCDKSRLYPGAIETLTAINNNNVKLACITNKASVFTWPLLEALGINALFDSVICGDQVERKKPDPMALLRTCSKFSISPSDSLMVGDSINDVMAAEAARIPVICVSYGYNRTQDLTRLENVKMIDSLAEILSFVGPKRLVESSFIH